MPLNPIKASWHLKALPKETCLKGLSKRELSNETLSPINARPTTSMIYPIDPKETSWREFFMVRILQTFHYSMIYISDTTLETEKKKTKTTIVALLFMILVMSVHIFLSLQWSNNKWPGTKPSQMHRSIFEK